MYAIRSYYDIEGITFRFIDTAGIRKTDDTIENMGISRTYNKIKQATIVLLMLDIIDEDEKIHEAVADVKAHVITSYSIHYTKLYDDGLGINGFK